MSSPSTVRASQIPQNEGVSIDARSARALERGRASYAKHAWLDAYESLSRADDASRLEPEDLELLATSAYMLGLDDEYVRALERAHYSYLDSGEVPRAARCTWWIGLNLLMRGEEAPATGWFARGERLLEREERDCVERGYLLLGSMLESFAEGDFEAARAKAAEAIDIGERFGDRDLVALGVMDQGHALLELGRTKEGLRLVDESMIAVTSGGLSPIVAGILYCNTISVCQGAYELRRAREWTTALTLWCEREPDMVAHTGVCLVHRAEIMQLQGGWQAALDEAEHVGGAGSAESASLRPRAVRPRRASSPAWRLRSSGAGVSHRNPAGRAAAAGAGTAPAGAGQHRRRACRDPPGRRRVQPATEACGAAPRPRRDRARGGRGRGGRARK